jgi:hypothetical protein
LFDYSGQSSRGPLIIEARNINPYLANAPDVYVEQQRRPISNQLSRVSFGSRPNDGGSLIITPDQYDEVVGDAIAARYVRKFVGSKELLHGGERWCLWLKDASPAEMDDSPVIRERLEACRAHRLSSKRKATQEWAGRPHLFDFDSQPSDAYLCVPGVVSETRPYFLASRLEPTVIASNLAFTLPDHDGFQFAIVSSSMFLTWQKSVGGRLESRLRFSNTVVWNNLPLPDASSEVRQQLAAAGREIELTRRRYPGVPLAHLYSPSSMPLDLKAAHDRLDVYGDLAFGASQPCRSEGERQEVLFRQYQRIVK